MTVTKEEIEKRFKEYNHLYFNDTLPTPFFSTCSNMHFVGMFTYNRINSDGMPYKPRITIAKDIEWEEDELRGIILHEMIHYYTFTIKHKDIGHVGLFSKTRKRIQKEYNINIPLTGLFLTRKGERKPSTRMGFLVMIIKHFIG